MGKSRRGLPDDDDAVDFIPDQRPALKNLRTAVEALHPEAIESVFNSPDPMLPEALVRKDTVLHWIDQAHAAWRGGRPPKARESAVVEMLARKFQEHSGHTASEPDGYLLNLLVFVRVVCYQNGVGVPTTYDGLRARLPAAVDRPK